MLMRHLLIVSLVLITLISSGCQLPSRETTFTRTDVEQFIEVQIPDGATDVEFATEAGIDQIVYVRFQLLSPDLASFLATMQFTESLQPLVVPFPLPTESGLTWWLQTKPTAFVGGSKHTGGKVYELLIDQSDQTLYVVYLRVYEL